MKALGPKRPVGRPFAPGQSGNPGGKPKGFAEFRELCRTHAAKAVRVLEEQLDSKNESTAREAALALLAYGFGRPTVAVEVSAGTGPSPAEAALLALATPVGEQVIDVQPSSPAKVADEVFDAEDDGAIW